jgi:hypothetical protein
MWLIIWIIYRSVGSVFKIKCKHTYEYMKAMVSFRLVTKFNLLIKFEIIIKVPKCRLKLTPLLLVLLGVSIIIIRGFSGALIILFLLDYNTV